jgi:hypothetical protein
METLLILNIDPDLEEDLVDYLLQLECVGGFTSWPVRGHGRHGALTLAEQVSGRRKRTQVEILMKAADVPEVLGGLAANVGRDITYWQQPVSDYGHIG